LLAEIAVEDKDGIVRVSAWTKRMDIVWRSGRPSSDFRHSTERVAEIVSGISDQLVVSELGYADVSAIWKEKTKTYYWDAGPRSGSTLAYGEELVVRAKFRGSKHELSRSWATSFPKEVTISQKEIRNENGSIVEVSPTSVPIVTAPMEASDFFTDICRLLPKAVVEKIVLESKCSPLRAGAASVVDDQGLLKDVALRDADYFVCLAAINRILDKSVLGEMAKNASLFSVNPDWVNTRDLDPDETTAANERRGRLVRERLAQDALKRLSELRMGSKSPRRSDNTKTSNKQ